MKENLSIKEKLQLCFFAAFVAAYLFSWPVLYYSNPKYDVEPHLSLYLFVPMLLASSIVFMAFASLVWGCIEGLVWLIKKYRPFAYCKELVKEISTSLCKDKGKHLLLHFLLIICNPPIQWAVNSARVFFTPGSYHFSNPVGIRVLDTLICYLLMLLLVSLFLKTTRCDVRCALYYAAIGVLPCIITALGLEWFEFGTYERELCSDWGV